MEIDIGKLSKPEAAIYAEAAELLRKGTDATAFSARFFGPGGSLSGLWSDRPERAELVKSDLFRWLQSHLADLRRTDAATFEREIEAVSGRLTVSVPRSLHVALKREAAGEGVSLSELIRLKLSWPYRQVTSQMLGGG